MVLKKNNDNIKIVNEYTFNKFLPLWESNLDKTITKIRFGRSVLGLSNLFKSEPVPAVVIAAGPSLDNNIDILNKYKDKVITICCDIVYKNISEYYFQPDFCTSIDAQPEIGIFFKDMKKSDTLLIAPTVTSNEVIKNWAGNRAFYNIKYENDYCMNIDENREIPIRVWLPTGNIVGNFSAVFAYFLGCNPIIMIGNDMAFTDLKIYSNLAACKKNEVNKFLTNETGNISEIVMNHNLISMKDIFGNDIISRKDYLFYNNWLAENIYPTTIVANCTEGGIVRSPIIEQLDRFISPYPEINKLDFYALTKLTTDQKKMKLIL